MIEYKGFFDQETMMKQWDSWRKYIAEGGGGSWPRDAFEALLDYFEERLTSQSGVEADAESRDDLEEQFSPHEWIPGGIDK